MIAAMIEIAATFHRLFRSMLVATRQAGTSRSARRASRLLNAVKIKGSMIRCEPAADLCGMRENPVAGPLPGMGDHAHSPLYTTPAGADLDVQMYMS